MGFFDRLGQYFGVTSTPNVAAGETPEEKQARMGVTGAYNQANGYANKVLAAPDAAPRNAPQVADPTLSPSARVGAAPQIGGLPQVSAGTVASAYDPSQANQARAQQAAYLQRLQGVEAGTAPSAAVDAMKMASNRNVAGAYALAGSKGGYGGSAIREAQRQQGAAGQQLVGQVGQERAAEAATAREQEGGALANMRGQDLTGAQAGAQLGLEAQEANQRTGLSAQQSNQQTGLEAARSNQAAALQAQLTQAGFNQDALMKLSDQELQAHLANAGFHLTQEQIDDLRANNQENQRQSAINSATAAASGNAANALALKQLRAQYALAAQKNDQAGMDRLFGMISKYAGGASSGGGGSGDSGGGGSGGGGSPLSAEDMSSIDAAYAV